MEYEQTLAGVQRWEVFFKTGKEALETENYDEAERHFLDALADAQKFGEVDPRLANIHNTLGELYDKQKEFEKAAQHYYKVTKIWEASLGPNYSGLIDVLNKYARVLHALGHSKESEEVKKRITEIKSNQS